MKKIIGFIILALMLSACIEVTDDNSRKYGNGDVLLCTDSNCTNAPSNTDEGDGDVVVCIFDADYSEMECVSAGFYYHTIEKVCLNQPIESGGCEG